MPDDVLCCGKTAVDQPSQGGFAKFRIAAPGTVPKTAKEENARSHRLTIKGQVTIPKEIRDFLGLEEGNSCVEFAVGEDGSVMLRKASVEKPRAASRSHSTSVRAAVHPRCSQSARQGGVLALLAGGF